MQPRQPRLDEEGGVIKSAKRALQLLELLKDAPEPLSTTVIAVKLNYPFSSTAALLKSLVALGYLVFDRKARTYHTSVRVGLLAGRQTREALDRLRDVSERLAAESRQAVLVAVRNAMHVQCIHVSAADVLPPFDLPVGSQHRLVDTAMGRALLALESDAAIDRLVRRANADRHKQQPHVCPAELARTIADIRSNGYAYSDTDFISGTGVIATPFILADHQPSLALGIAGPAARIETELSHFAARLREAASEIGIQSPSENVRKRPNLYRLGAVRANGAGLLMPF